MTFSTYPGSGGAPDSFVGTSGVDAITFVGSTTNFFLGAQGENDSIAFAPASIFSPLVITNATLRGGAGDDLFATAFEFFGEDAVSFNNVLLNGNADDDQILLDGSFAGSSILGGQGNDYIDIAGEFLNSRVNGNQGDDEINIIGPMERTSIFGGQGEDKICIDANGFNPINGSNSIIRGDDDDDTIYVTGTFVNSTINGNAGDDLINVSIGGSGDSDVLIYGGAGDDEINATGSSAHLALFGNEGSDTITGGTGDDTITGGTGADIMTGGAGEDTFVFSTGDSLAATGKFSGGVSFSNGVDFITDFQSDVDTYLVNGVTFESTDFAANVGRAAIDESGNYVILDVGDEFTTTFGIRGSFDKTTNTFTDDGTGSYLFFQASASKDDVVNSLTTEAIISDLAIA